MPSGGELLLRYHKQESEVPDGIPKFYRRSGYIHPLMTPDGRELTGDYAADHAHQHGIFFAWTSGKYAGEKIDFWNQKKEEGRVAHKTGAFETGEGRFGSHSASSCRTSIRKMVAQRSCERSGR